MRKNQWHKRVSTDPHILAASVSANVLAFALPLLMLQVYDRIIPRQGVETLTVLAIGMIIAVTLEMVLRTARAHLMALAGEAYEINIRAKLFERLLKADLSEIEVQAPGVHLDRIAGVDQVRSYRFGEASMAALDLPFSIAFLVVVMIISPILAAVILTLLGVSILVIRRMQNRSREFARNKQEIDQRRFTFLIEVLSRFESIKSLNLEQFMERRYERLLSSTAQVGSEATRRSNFTQSVTGSVGQVAPVIIASAGAILVIQQSLTVGALAAVILLGTRIIQPVLKYAATKTIDDVARRAEQEIEHTLAIPLPATGAVPCPRIDRLELSNVQLTLPEREQPIFKGLDLQISRGEISVIDGSVGTGRSSLLWLIMNYFKPEIGSITINDQPISSYDQVDVRGRFAYLPSRPKMLEGTVLENMTRFQPEKYLDDALEIAAALGLEDYFASHQEGLITRVGNGLDAGLPTSIAERIPLVGALVGHPDVVLFDEANANLDMEGDTKLKNYIASLKGHTAVIMVTQRPSYIQLADNKYRLVDGRLVLETNNAETVAPQKILGKVAS